MPLSYTIRAVFPNSACKYGKGKGCQLTKEVEKTRVDDYEKVKGITEACPAFQFMRDNLFPLLGTSERLMYSKVSDGRFMVFSEATTERSDLHVTVYSPDIAKGAGPDCDVAFDYIGEDDHRESVLKAYDTLGLRSVDRDPKVE